MATVETAVNRAAALLVGAERVVVLTGAGISTESGIPDFRGPDGVWTRDPEAERLSNIDAYLADPDVRRQAWAGRLSSPVWTAEPNRGHRALVTLERAGRLHLLVTQNIDGLHQLAGSDPDRIVEIHGTLRDVVCLRCDARGPAGPTLERVRAGEEDPACLADAGNGACGGILKSATISFGQQLVASDLEQGESAAATCDVLLAVGTSLAVYPAAGLVPIALDNGAALIVVNGEPTPFDGLAAVVARGRIGELLPEVVAPAL